jgi:SagB-type dehydrogenase family enzyme
MPAAHATISICLVQQRIGVVSMKPVYLFLRFFFFAIFLSTSGLLMTSAADDTRGPIKLPQPVRDGKTSIEKSLSDRRSIRQYKNLPITLADLAQLLWAAQGMSGTGGRRTAPSAGALYPLELCVVAGNVTGLSAGIYLYDPLKHELNRTTEGDARSELSKAALNQPSIKNAPAVLVISAVFERTTIKYGERGVRYVHMEAGHAAQNVYLQAAALDLGTVVIGAFGDDAVIKVLGLPERQQPLYIMPIGRK